MSYDLGIWWEPEPSTADDADTKFLAMVDTPTGVVTPDDELVTFTQALLAQYPLVDDDICRWSSPPDVTPERVIVTMPYPNAEQMTATVRDLADQHGLVLRDRSPDDHYRTQADSTDGLVDAFTRYLAGDDSWRTNLTLTRVEL